MYDASMYWNSNSFIKHEVTSETPLNFNTNMYPNHITSAEQRKQYNMNQENEVTNHNMLPVNNNYMQNETYNTNEIDIGNITYVNLSPSSCWVNVNNNRLCRNINDNNNFTYNRNKKVRLNEDVAISFANM